LTAKTAITGIILAGGKSSRMGEDKSLMAWKGKRLIEYSIEALSPLCKKIVISSNKNQYQFTGCEVWQDELPQQAPMIGIYSCLKRTITEINLILSCDMPLISTSVFEYLLSNSDGYEAIITVHDHNQAEPLCGIYKRSLIPSIEKCILRQDFSLLKFLDAASHLKVEIGQGLSFFNEKLFLNINTIDDFKHLP
jgi:molybdopterin-guanine dinucleotide biosynthesis protein A